MIVVRNASGRRCWLAGPLRLAGLDHSGRVVTMTIAYRHFQQGTAKPARGVVLRPGFIASVHVLAEYRDDPHGWRGLCARRHQIEPASWRLVLAAGASITIRNADPGNPYRGLTADNGLLTCKGQLDRPAPVVVARSVD